MIRLTEEQHQAIAGEESPIVLDPHDNASFVLVPTETFERIKKLLCDDTELNDVHLRTLFARSWAANGWDDPRMDDYDRYDENRP